VPSLIICRSVCQIRFLRYCARTFSNQNASTN